MKCSMEKINFRESVIITEPEEYDRDFRERLKRCIRTQYSLNDDVEILITNIERF